MAARVLHFGWDDCYRVSVLRSAGFEVRAVAALDTLELELTRPEGVDAVVVSEREPLVTEAAADLVRSKSAAPVILFRRSVVDLHLDKFDRVYASYVTPQLWLNEAAKLIAESRALRTEAQALRRTSKTLRCEVELMQEETRRQVTRLQEELQRNRDLLNE